MKYSLAICVLFLFTGIAKTYAEESPRTWKDKSGNFQVKAKLVSVNEKDASVTIELVDGRDVDVAMERLSVSDRRYLVRAKKRMSAGSSKRPRKDGTHTGDWCGIRWHESLDRAAAEAHNGFPLGTEKPILCFRVLGDLDGFM